MVTVNEIAKELPDAVVEGDKNQIVRRLKRLDEADSASEDLRWCSDKNASMIASIQQGTVICSPATRSLNVASKLNYILVHNPRLAFQIVMKKFFSEPEIAPSVAPTAQIHPSVKLGSSVSIGHYAVIEKDCVIGDHCTIGSHTVLHRSTVLGAHVRIGAHCTIGGVGFGYERDAQGVPQLVPHLGNVQIDSYTEIGSNTAIDRAVLGSTLIEEHVKIDNLVHVGHNAVIKRGAFLIAHAMIGGSTVVGPNSWIAPSAALIHGISVGEGATVGLGAVVIRSVPDKATVVGNPGKELQKKSKEV